MCISQESNGDAHPAELGEILIKDYWKGDVIGDGIVFGEFGKDSRKQGVPLD